MVAPGHCSPSRKVVSKMTTRSFSDGFCAVMERSFFLAFRASLDGRPGVLQFDRPLSAQAHAPGRPSGAGKKKQTAKNEGGIGPGRVGPPVQRASIEARGHAKKPSSLAFEGRGKR
jgi:hypothetical protein